MTAKRKKNWKQKVSETRNCIIRCQNTEGFAEIFYENLFFLEPKLEKYFKNTDWKHQHMALVMALDHILGFLDEKDQCHRNNLVRIGETHSKKNLNIHPHNYYYWIDAMVLTVRNMDESWYDDLEYYLRECLFFPISFLISLYYK